MNITKEEIKLAGIDLPSRYHKNAEINYSSAAGVHHVVTEFRTETLGQDPAYFLKTTSHGSTGPVVELGRDEYQQHVLASISMKEDDERTYYERHTLMKPHNSREQLTFRLILRQGGEIVPWDRDTRPALRAAQQQIPKSFYHDLKLARRLAAIVAPLLPDFEVWLHGELASTA